MLCVVMFLWLIVMNDVQSISAHLLVFPATAFENRAMELRLHAEHSYTPTFARPDLIDRHRCAF